MQKRRSTSKAVQSQDAISFPIRINKYLAAHNYSTRKGADELVAKGLVFVNGVRATLGQMVGENDRVELRRKGKVPQLTYLLCHKPVGMSTIKLVGDTTDVRDLVGPQYRSLSLFPIGRLDKATSGLIIMTNDGRITDKVLNPRHGHTKTYEVHTKLPLRTSFQDKMEQGISEEGLEVISSRIEILGEKSFRITVTEGRTQQIRHKVASLFNEVVSMRRTGIMHLSLSQLAVGTCREMSDRERSQFLQELGL